VPARTRSLACKMKINTRVQSPQVQPVQPGLPRAMVYRLIPRSPRRANSSCRRRPRIEGAFRPVGRNWPPRTWHQQRVSGPHGFTVRGSAFARASARQARPNF
jgi:hypothetical protein